MCLVYFSKYDNSLKYIYLLVTEANLIQLTYILYCMIILLNNTCNAKFFDVNKSLDSNDFVMVRNSNSMSECSSGKQKGEGRSDDLSLKNDSRRDSLSENFKCGKPQALATGFKGNTEELNRKERNECGNKEASTGGTWDTKSVDTDSSRCSKQKDGYESSKEIRKQIYPTSHSTKRKESASFNNAEDLSCSSKDGGLNLSKLINYYKSLGVLKSNVSETKTIDNASYSKSVSSSKHHRKPIAETRTRKPTEHKANTCPEASTPSDSLPLDVRNLKLVECVEKFSKIDPAQVIRKCSQYVDVVKRTQHVQRHASKTMDVMMTSKRRQLVGRWSPSVALYLATASLVTVYVTEWKAVLHHVPFYSHLSEEEETTV